MVTIIDADGLILGRLSTHAAKRLLKDEEVAVVNSEKALITGKKASIKRNYMQKREVGTYRKGPFFHRMPDKIVKRTIRGMLPYQTPHGRSAFKRLKCYIGIPKEFEGKKFEVVEKVKNKSARYMTIEELSKFLGAQF
ncbi:LSU ribosomal protein L13P [Thermoplasmatales archaeon SCGC AB-539-N05]|nr:LSU ribosomal protein L13P [Thermoplasmatales archaeon SCGC AB-539-N05]